uniref:NB-ARC domain-containing protein n=1 Tax=Physcomitrium patens TaxID=3218 RepID=A0A7I4FE46_PHYPA
MECLDIQMKYEKDSVIWMTVGLDAKVSDLYEKLGRCCILDNGVSEKFKLIKNQEEQRTFLKNAYAEKKVFLILDDVWEKPKYDHHDMLYWLDISRGPGSATLITSRSKSVLCKVQAKVEVVLSLPKEESWKLFCCHAFESDGALPTTLEELARDVCEECKGLPLALKVIGSAMADKATVAEWRCALHDLRRSKPIVDSNVDDELFGRLELSYKELKDDATRICFLYFAAFPEDYEIEADKLLRMWVAEELFGLDLSVEEAKDKARAHLEILVRRSLIDWNQGSKYVHIYDVLRDLAMHIIGKAERGECGYECFFQSRKENAIIPETELLKDLKRMSFMSCNICKWPEDLQMPHLKVCILREISDIQRELLTDIFKKMPNLKFLDLSSNNLLDGQVPYFGSLVSLTHLELQRNPFHEFPMSVVNLYKLVSLNVAKCGSLEALPESIGNLNSLVDLDLNICRSLKALPKSIGNLNSLVKLNLRDCQSLEALPKSIGNLNSLVDLDLFRCRSLKALPKSIGNLNSLVDLDLFR